jgi:hypothetical protein
VKKPVNILPPYFFKPHFNIIPSYIFRSLMVSSHQNFELKYFIYFLSCFLIWLLCVKSIQIMKLLIMKFPSSSHYILFCRFNYSAQHPTLKHPQSMFFPYGDKLSFLPT